MDWKTSPQESALKALGLLLVTCLSACSTPHQSEVHKLRELTVVFLDQKSLVRQYEQISGRPGVGLTGTAAMSRLVGLRGFYDEATRTVYCRKMDIEACGHVFHHAVLGHFQPE